MPLCENGRIYLQSKGGSDSDRPDDFERDAGRRDDRFMADVFVLVVCGKVDGSVCGHAQSVS